MRDQIKFLLLLFYFLLSLISAIKVFLADHKFDGRSIFMGRCLISNFNFFFLMFDQIKECIVKKDKKDFIVVCDTLSFALKQKK
jgi:hypothetical protein